MRVFLSVVAVTGLLAGPVVAQTPRGPVPASVGLTAASGELRTASSATAELRRAVAADTVRESHWLKGGIIGGVGLTLGALVLGSLFDGQRDSGLSGGEYFRAALYGGALGFGIGALIGGQFEK